MTSNSPWSVKGVAHEAREAAKIAARKSGQPIGVWLSQTILAAATQELKRGYGADRSQPRYPEAPPSNMGGGMPGTAYPPNYAHNAPRPPALTTQAVIESINKLSTRIDAAEQRTTAQIQPIMRKVDHMASQMERVDEIASQIGRVDQISAQLEELKTRGNSGGATTAPVERAVMRMSERLQKLEQRVQPGSGRADPKGKGGGIFARLFRRG
jgi:hypothetical protein